MKNVPIPRKELVEALYTKYSDSIGTEAMKSCFVKSYHQAEAFEMFWDRLEITGALG